MTLADDVLAGSRRALARLLTRIENEEAPSELAALYPHTGRAWIIGVTGAPGTGKSSLVNALATAYRAQGKTVGIIAVDPTSPFTGGAILGDRIRMSAHSGDPGVFIRSMATRGSLGGLSRTARDAARALDAAGFDIVLIETVGAGQSEVDIVRTAHTTLVVEAPGLGDDVQAIKAGILEIADVLVVNKADRPGAVNTVRVLRAMLELGHPAARTSVQHHGQTLTVDAPAGSDTDAATWIPPIVQTVATLAIDDDASGLPALIDAISAHRRHLETGGQRARIERLHLEQELHERLRAELMARLLRDLPRDTFDALIDDVQSRHIDPHTAVQTILSRTTGGAPR
ncbi:MAG TPA: methylmalonyl Co-A mutase-associated GTPase MeaB [Aggregatilineales bacterium]|nr:methylmalonyl Co-A mutase-associated GTPase MeaB [Aggregatilineales bacterium]